MQKKCSVCGEMVDNDMIACPKCGHGVFETEKLHSESAENGKDVPGNGEPHAAKKAGFLGKLFAKKPSAAKTDKAKINDNKNNGVAVQPLSGEDKAVMQEIEQRAQTQPPGPSSCARTELAPGEERRYCSLWNRNIVLVPNPLGGLPDCEWSLPDRAEKVLCHQFCVHSMNVHDSVSSFVTGEEMAYAVMLGMGIVDYAPKK